MPPAGRSSRDPGGEPCVSDRNHCSSIDDGESVNNERHDNNVQSSVEIGTPSTLRQTKYDPSTSEKRICGWLFVNSLSQWPVTFYIPNLMGYARIFLAFYGYQAAMKNQPNQALNRWIVAAVLDLFDGIVARRLNQCSKFGVLLDIVADNILRSIVWISAITETRKDSDVSVIPIIWTALIFLEWITMFCSQSKVNESSEENHWKDMDNTHTPFWVEAVFRNNFKTVPGISAICGLFIAPLASYVFYAEETWARNLLSRRGTFFFLLLSHAARTLSALVELWICLDYTRHIIKQEYVRNDGKTKVA
eukprot:CCRYP_016372-RA/>CCRYP_016372-RA protein AED:0.00 eAED:0.00 QI:302/-1/1/1/-1/1/1/185/305